MRMRWMAFFIILLPLAVHAQDLNDELWAAARKGDAPTVKALLAKGAEVNAKLLYGTTALSYAADRSHLEVVEVLVEHGDEDGDLTVLKAGKQKEVLHEINMGSAVYTTPIAKNGVLYVTNRSTLFALQVK